MEDEIKYAVYVVLVEDSERSFERMADAVDSFEDIKRDITYGEALEIVAHEALDARENYA